MRGDFCPRNQGLAKDGAGDHSAERNQKMPKIVLAHSGTGKSFCAKNFPTKFLHLPISPYKYFPKDQVSENEAEATAGIYPAEIMNPEFPLNYVHALKESLKKAEHEYILAPSDFGVAHWLEEIKIPYTLVYPEKELKGEYQQRYLNRGNDDRFLGLFVGKWDLIIWMNDILTPQERIRLSSGQYLGDVL
ncbi:MAG: hypothetical protein RR642_17370 [Solibacillus sp.]